MSDTPPEGWEFEEEAPDGWAFEDEAPMPDVVEVRHLEEGESQETLAAAGVDTVKDEVAGGRGFGATDVDTGEARGGSNVTRRGGRRNRSYDFAAPIPITGRVEGHTGPAQSLGAEETPEEAADLEADESYPRERDMAQALAAPRGDSASGIEVSSLPAAVRPLYQRPGALLTSALAGPLAGALVGQAETPSQRVTPGFAAGAGQAATFGEADEIYGRVAQLTGGDYERSRDLARERYRQAEDMPGHFAGEVAGTALTMPLIPNAPRAASVAGRIGQAMAEGAGMGALQGFGRSEADDAAGVFLDSGTGAGGGAVAGGLFGAGGEVMRAGGQRLARTADANAAQLRARAAGIRYAPDVDAAQGYPGGIEALAQRLRDLNISRGLRGTEEAGRRAGEARRAAGDRMGAISREMDEIAERTSRERAAAQAAERAQIEGETAAAGYRVSARPAGPDTPAVPRGERGEFMPWPELIDQPAAAPVPGRVRVRELLAEIERVADEHAQLPSGEPITRAARAYADRIRPHASEGLPFGAAHRERQMLDARIPFDQRATHPLGALDRQRAGFRSRLSEAMDEAIEGAAGPERRTAWREANRDYGAARLADRGNQRLQRRGNANRLISLTDSIAGGAGVAGVSAAMGGFTPEALATGAALAVGNRAIRGREHAIGATVLETIQHVARTQPQALSRWPQMLDAARQGSEAIAATHYVLMQQDEEYGQVVVRAERARAAAERLRGDGDTNVEDQPPP